MAYNLSPSSLNLMEECPRCFYMQIVNKIRRPSGPISSIPIKMDSIIKRYFDAYRKKGKLPPLAKGKVKGVLCQNMPKTLSYEDGKNGFVLKGLPDEFVEDNGVIMAFDHKTKSKAPEETHPSYQFQLDCYTFLLEKNGYKTTNKAYLGYYYPEESDLHNGMKLNLHVAEVTTNSSRVKKALEKAHKILRAGIPKKNATCQYCNWEGSKIPYPY